MNKKWLCVCEYFFCKDRSLLFCEKKFCRERNVVRDTLPCIFPSCSFEIGDMTIFVVFGDDDDDDDNSSSLLDSFELMIN